jgi:hypothetical protein
MITPAIRSLRIRQSIFLLVRHRMPVLVTSLRIRTHSRRKWWHALHSCPPRNSAVADINARRVPRFDR